MQVRFLQDYKNLKSKYMERYERLNYIGTFENNKRIPMPKLQMADELGFDVLSEKDSCDEHTLIVFCERGGWYYTKQI